MSELPALTFTPRSPDRSVQLVEIAERQWGVLTRGQLEDAGLAGAAITRWLDSHRLHRVYPGVYCLGHRRLGTQGRLAAALFYAGKGAALRGKTGAWWMRIIGAPPSEIHVNAPADRRSVPGLCIHRPRSLARVIHNGLPVTPPAQTLLDIADDLRMSQLRRALAEAEYLELVTLDEVAAVLGRGKPGSARLRAALECHRPELARTKSVLEEKFLRLCERHSLTPPEVNVEVAGRLVDAVWFDQKLVVELDGYDAHRTRARLEADHQRDLDLRAAGYAVRRYTWRQVTETPELLVRDLEGAAQLARERGDRYGEQHREEDDRPGRAAAPALAEVEQR